MLLSAVSVLVVAQSSSEIPEGLMNNPVYIKRLALEMFAEMSISALANCPLLYDFNPMRFYWQT